MFNYIADISVLSHNIIRDNIKSFDIAIDATLGNGKDTDFLSKYFKKVYSFEIQHIAIENYENKEIQNVHLIEESHELIGNIIKSSVDCIIYNLGYLPGGDKNITTNCKSTLISIKKGLELLKSQGIMAISMYSGHEEGKREKEEILKYASSLNKLLYGSMLHETLNRNNAPSLLIIEKS